jgi:hypothetical protein
LHHAAGIHEADIVVTNPRLTGESVKGVDFDRCSRAGNLRLTGVAAQRARIHAWPGSNS